MDNEDSWRDGFVAAMRRTRASNDEISTELAAAYAKARAEGKTPKGALGDPQAYAAALPYRGRVANLAEALAGAAHVVGAFMLIDALRAMKAGRPYDLTVGGLLSWVLVIAGIPALLWAFRRYSSMAVLGSAIVLMLVWVFLSNAATPTLLSVGAVLPAVLGLGLGLGAMAYVARYLAYHNAHPIRDPLTGQDVRFPDPEPRFMQRWGPLVMMGGGLAVVVLASLL
ncbi:hypothetical protein [Cumulibacter manganitolerans]|uniref:hypothetical protein n=1 Tax=Cumulibacter manganitolerans TaxID=1884992 RepID=UPI001294B408|nr:hypothetical protein [Cumulibacter manganitolerans]